MNKLTRLFLPYGVNKSSSNSDSTEKIIRERNPNSMHIDFMLVNCEKDSNKIIVDAFDVTTDKDVDIIRDKISKFLKSYQLF